MTRFQDLLKPDFNSTPQADQQRASLRLPDVVKGSRLYWWTKGSGLTIADSLLVVLIAPYSHYDLVMLDLLDEEISRRTQVLPIYVGNLQLYQSAEELTNDFPIITRAPVQTPVTAVRESGEWRKIASGKPARDLAATTLGIRADEFNDRVIERVPTYIPSV
jgi:hypothetical protein